MKLLNKVRAALMLGAFAFCSVPSLALAEKGPEGVNETPVVQEVPPFESEEEYAAWKKQLVEAGAPPEAGNPLYANGRVYNEFLEYAVSGSGNFTIGTTGGNPNTSRDNYARLLYGHPNPGTSKTTVVVDGGVYQYSPNRKAPTVNVALNQNTSEQMINNVVIQQVISLKHNASTNRNDTVEIKYVATNHDTRTHNVGLRIMMDTMLGSNDAAPFRIPGTGAVTTEREYVGSQIPEYFQVFDDLVNPTVTAQGSLRASINPPDKVQFTNWGNVTNTLWNYTVKPGYSNGDSAVSMIWNLKGLAPGESREYATHYGLADFSQDLRPPVALSLTGASTIEATERGYSPNPFTVTAYLQNIGSATANHVQATLNLPDGLRLANGQNATVSVGSMTVRAERQLSWQVVVDPAKSARHLTYSVTLTGSNTDTKTVSRNVFVPAFVEAVKTPKLSVQPVQPNGENGWYVTPLQVTVADSAAPAGTKFEYRLGTSSGAGEWIEYKGPFTPQDGVFTIEYRAISPQGAISEPGTASLKLDTAAPETQAVLNSTLPVGSNGWYRSPVTVALSATDATSGVARTEYRILENGAEPGIWNPYTEGIVLDRDCNCILQVRSTDQAGNVEEIKSQAIRIDQTAPTLAAALTNQLLWPPNHKYVPVAVKVDGQDAMSGIESIVLLSITSNESDEGLGDGNHAVDVIDAQLGTFDTVFSVRAERSGQGTGRVYTVTYQATDRAGNVTTATVTIAIPHDQR